ncbi:MAG: AMP-binding protein [Sphaerochaetaceae bacterium]|nr:AMP-binding protein [Sphaerochaetaceae bacterium]MDC7238374.1 AMP-binding protein [Sphaerochaetaceae bacterium]
MVKTIAQMFHKSVLENPELTLIGSKNNSGKFIEETYKEVEDIVINLALGLKDTFNLKKQDLVAIISDNRKEWLYSDLALQYLNCADVPRGLDATDVELIQILNDTKVTTCFVENVSTIKRFDGLKEKLPHLETLILMDNDVVDFNSNYKIKRLYDLIEKGENLLEKDPSHKNLLIKNLDKASKNDLATIIFTSGTTGACKGVMLTNDNFIYEITNLQSLVDYKFEPGQRWMTVLPIWHSLERAVTYVALNYSQSIFYSKPISKIMLSDFKKVNPHWFSSVPRIWQSVNKTIESKIRKTKGAKKTISLILIKNAKEWKLGYNKVHNLLPQYKENKIRLFEYLHGLIKMALHYPIYKLGQKMMFKKIKGIFGTNLIAGVCGGGSMPKGVDDFFNAIGITLLDGYGMTETAPIISVRNLRKPILGTMQVIDGCEFKVVDENNKEVSFNEKGVLKVKGRQVMKGYFNNEEETKKIIDKDGYLNTGDLVLKTVNNDISIVGRAKDTIVLAGGENLEPVPIEGKLSELDFIDNVIVIGQDRKYLSALIVPNFTAIKEYIDQLGDKYKDDKEAIHNFIKEKIDEKINCKLGFKTYELINKFAILEKPFEVGKELSAKQELKRNIIEECYKKEIDTLYA